MGSDIQAVAVALAPYAALLALFYVVLTIRVVRARRIARVGIGTGSNPALARAIRVHGNFIEYTPFSLLLILLMGLVGAPIWAVHALAATLVLGRLIHAFGVSRDPEVIRYRIAGMMLTFAVLVIAALALGAASVLSFG